MFCGNCGTKLSEGAKFCSNCGTPVAARPDPAQPEPEVAEENSSSLETEPTATEEKPAFRAVRKRRSLEDTAVDFVSSKISGKEVRTVSISMEDMITLLTEHFIRIAETDEYRKKFRKVATGAVLNDKSKSLNSADGKYNLLVNASSVPGMQQLKGSLHNWVRVHEIGTGTIYQYEALSWGKFKSAITAAMDENWA